MKGKKNDFSLSFWDDQGNRILFLEYVHDTDKAIAWADAQKINWSRVNIYERRTRKLLGQQQKKQP